MGRPSQKITKWSVWGDGSEVLMIDEGGAGGRTSVGESVGEAMWIIAVEKSMITESEVFLCFRKRRGIYCIDSE